MMKFTYFLLACTLFCTFSYGQIKESKGHVINARGDIYFEGTKLGTVSKQQIIQYGLGEKIAFLDAEGKVIGNVHDSYKGVACAIHCFQK